MISKKPTSPVKSTTQKFLEIRAIQDDILLLESGNAVCVIEVGAVNFYLLSSDEQNSMVYAFANLMNSLNFPIQILILSKRMDISSYLEYIQAKINEQNNQLIRSRLHSYQEFIKNTVKKNTVLEKRFFVVVPFNLLELGAKAITQMNASKEYLISRAKVSLYPKRDHIYRLLAKTGLRATVLQKQELVELYYNLYNTSATGKRLAPIDTYTDVVISVG